jgi:hypothetical protein
MRLLVLISALPLIGCNRSRPAPQQITIEQARRDAARLKSELDRLQRQLGQRDGGAPPRPVGDFPLQADPEL